MRGGTDFKNGRTKSKPKGLKSRGIGKLYHGRPVVFAQIDDPEFHEQVYKRKNSIRITFQSLFFIGITYVIGDIIYLTWFQNKYIDIDKLIYIL